VAVTTTVAPTAQGPRPKKWIDLQVGDCLADPPPTDPAVVDVSVIDCGGVSAHRRRGRRSHRQRRRPAV
jgi:hypothetical protein